MFAPLFFPPLQYPSDSTPTYSTMEVELPDPATIWKELGEFQSAVDSYVKQQGDLADRLRRAHTEFCQDQKSTPFGPSYPALKLLWNRIPPLLTLFFLTEAIWRQNTVVLQNDIILPLLFCNTLLTPLFLLIIDKLEVLEQQKKRALHDIEILESGTLISFPGL